MKKHLVPVLASVAMLGLVGGVAAAQAFTPAQKQQTVTVVPAAELVEQPAPVPAATTKTAAPVAKAPAKAKPAAVPSKQKPATSTKAKTVDTTPQRQAVTAQEEPAAPAPAAPPAPVRGASGGTTFEEVTKDAGAVQPPAPR